MAYTNLYLVKDVGSTPDPVHPQSYPHRNASTPSSRPRRMTLVCTAAGYPPMQRRLPRAAELLNR
jgi:hypothetical protein